MARILILGATSAIAEACARRYASADNQLCLVARNGERLAMIAEDLRVRGAATVATLKTDLTAADAAAAVINFADSTMGGLDLVLLAHGILPDNNAVWHDPALISETFAVNTVSAIALLSLAAERMAGHGTGTIAAISSVAGDRGRASNAVYGASKAALDVFLAGLRNRHHRNGINVLTIKPGFVNTPMTAHLEPGPLWAEPDTIAAGIVRAIARRRHVVYLPGFWRAVMLVIRNIPEAVFKRLSL